MSFRVEHTSIDEAIVAQLVEQTPESWTEIELVVTVWLAHGVQSMKHEISSPQGHPDHVSPTEALVLLTRKNYLLFETASKPWTSARNSVRVNSDGSMNYGVKYNYG
jgi:hypothetical protein